MMAKSSKGIYKRGNYYWISYKGSNGNIVRESTRTTKQREAEAILTSRKHSVLEKQEPAIKKIVNVTFKELVNECHEAFAIKKSYSVDKHILEQLSREFGNLTLNDFNVDLVERFQVKIIKTGLESLNTRGIKNGAKPCKPATANKLISVIKRAFSKAYKSCYCTEEKLKEIRSVKLLKADNARTNYLSLDQIQRMIEACDVTNDTKYLKPIIIFALNTGCRKNEIFTLKWNDVDLTH
jgi:integrase